MPATSTPAPRRPQEALVAGWLVGLRSHHTRTACRRDVTACLLRGGSTQDPLAVHRAHVDAAARTIEQSGASPAPVAASSSRSLLTCKPPPATPSHHPRLHPSPPPPRRRTHRRAGCGAHRGVGGVDHTAHACPGRATLPVRRLALPPVSVARIRMSSAPWLPERAAARLHRVVGGREPVAQMSSGMTTTGGPRRPGPAALVHRQGAQLRVDLLGSELHRRSPHPPDSPSRNVFCERCEGPALQEAGVPRFTGAASIA